MFGKCFPLHVAASRDGYDWDGLCLRDVRSAQQVQQVEPVDGGHLHVGEQDVKSRLTQSIQQFVYL